MIFRDRKPMTVMVEVGDRSEEFERSATASPFSRVIRLAARTAAPVKPSLLSVTGPNQGNTPTFDLAGTGSVPSLGLYLICRNVLLAKQLLRVPENGRTA